MQAKALSRTVVFMVFSLEYRTCTGPMSVWLGLTMAESAPQARPFEGADLLQDRGVAELRFQMIDVGRRVRN